MRELKHKDIDLKIRLVPEDAEGYVYSVWKQDYTLTRDKRYLGEIDLRKFGAIFLG